MEDGIPEDFEETKEYQLTVAVGILDKWMMDIDVGDAIEDFPRVPLMRFIIGTLSQLLPTWRKSLHYDLRVEQIGSDKAFIEMMAELTGIKLEEE